LTETKYYWRELFAGSVFLKFVTLPDERSARLIDQVYAKRDIEK